MISRDEFGKRATERLRNVLEKQRRAVLTRVEADRLADFARTAGPGSAGDVARFRASTSESAVHEAEINLLASLDEYADVLYDALETAIERAMARE